MPPKLPLPRGWKHRVRSSVFHILALSHYTVELTPIEIRRERWTPMWTQGSGAIGRVIP